MTLKEKITKDVLDMPLITSPTKKEISDYEKGISNLEKIADEFAIEFSLWKETNAQQDDNGLYYGESRIQVSRHNPVTIQKLLEIYKKEKGL